MTGAITIMIVFIVLAIISNIRMDVERERIKELEDKLDEYYKKREQRLMKHKKDQTNANRGIEIGRERLKTIREYRGDLIEAGLKQ